MKKLGKFYNNITKIEIIMKAEKEQHAAEALVSVSRGTRLVGRVIHADPRAAIDLVADKLERQLKRFKARLKNRRGGRRGEGPACPGIAGEGRRRARAALRSPADRARGLHTLDPGGAHHARAHDLPAGGLAPGSGRPGGRSLTA